MRCDTVWRHARLATMSALGEGLGICEDGLIAAKDGRILYSGARALAPSFAPARTISCDGRWVTPGLIDCHTHLVYAGDRAAEFEQRCRGEPYEAIARAGGGILSTVRATRAASEESLLAQSLRRLDAFIAEGVTTIEVKSGYGLETAAELKTLRIARRLGRERPIRVATTFLGAHACAPEFADKDDYIDHVCTQILPAVLEQGLADAVDVYCDRIGFTLEQSERVFAAAKAAGLPIKMHAEQLSNQHGAALGAKYGALSADHLEYLDDAGVAQMKAAGTVATLLPGAYYFMRETQTPPIAALRAAGVPIAIATDCNPGTSPLSSLLVCLNMAATLFRLSITECLLGATRNAAKALGLEHEIGSLEAGKACDLAVWNVESLTELVYTIGANPLHQRVWRGQ